MEAAEEGKEIPERNYEADGDVDSDEDIDIAEESEDSGDEE